MPTLAVASTHLGVCPWGLAARADAVIYPLLMQGSKVQTENLQSLAQGLLERTQAFQTLVQGRLGDCAETPADVLNAAVKLVREAHALLSWLNRY